MDGRDYLALARAYEADVLAKRIPACKWVRLACERNKRDRKKQRTAAFPYYFDDVAAGAICAAAEQFPHIKGPKAKVVGADEEGRPRWQTIELEAWQCWVLTTLFGWKRADTGMRRFRIGLILVPRKNAKSTIGAVVLLFMLAPDGEMGAECYSAATTRPQASIVSRLAWDMAQRTPDYREYFGVKLGSRTSRSLEVPEVASKAEPLSADAETLDGLNVHLAVIDELHAHRTRDLWDVLDTATGAREQPLLLAITTAGSNTAGICYEQVTYLQKILQGVVQDESYFGIYYTLDEKDDPYSVASAKKSNPNYGVSVRPDDLERKATRAKASPAARNNYLTKHHNIFVKADVTWMPMEAWGACANAKLTLEQLAGYPCWLGVDLAEVRDVAALVALFKLGPTKYAAIPRLYLPEETIEKSPIAQMSGWVEEGHLIKTDGNIADFLRIEDDIVDLCGRLDVQTICFDRALASQMQQSLQRRKEGVPEIITVNQNLQVMNAAMQSLERLVMSGRDGFEHPDNPCFTWMFSNIVVTRNWKDEIYPRKAGGKDSPNKIDGPVATFNALSVAETADNDGGAAAYDEDGVFTV
jgi:phage terminase large subunit-like protein